MTIFITGVGRSGTTLLQSMLAGHPEISFPPETGFLRKQVFSLMRRGPLTFPEALTLEPRLERLRPWLPSDDMPERFADEKELYIWLLEAVRKKKGGSIAGDKDPRLVEFMDGVSRLFPGARFVQIIRDPRDVLLSKKRAQWAGKRRPLLHIVAGYLQTELGRRLGRRLGPARYYRLHYEHLLQQPEEELARLCDFLGVSFEPSMLEFQQQASDLTAPDERQWKREAAGPLLTDNTGKWKGELKEWEVALIESLCCREVEPSGGGHSGTESFGKDPKDPDVTGEVRSGFRPGSAGHGTDMEERLYPSSGALHGLPPLRKWWFRRLLVPGIRAAGRVYIFWRMLHQRLVVWRKG